jgi:pimeloyl-ACP methyl ester carboxylesterase
MGAAMWAPQRAAVPGWKILTPSMPGFDGQPPAAERTVDAYARDLLATLDRQGVGRAVFAGLSMGGYVLFGVLRQAPDRVEGLLLADTRTSTDTDQRLAARYRSIDLARRLGPSAIADDMLPAVLGPTTHAERPDVVAEVRRLIEAQPAETIVAALEAMIARPDATDSLAPVRVPTAIVVGDEDRITTVADAEHMQRHIPGATVETLPRAGHMSNLEAPDAFNASLRALVARVEHGA